jgi:glycosyltransferase involved in cell wall biosynthesis
MRVAIVHYWFTQMRGGERVVEALCELFPEADVFTHVYDPAAVTPVISRHRVRTTFVDRLPFSRRLLATYLPLMPLALEQLDFRGYDLVISSESGPAKGIIPAPAARHICYCHSPMRYVWDMYNDYLDAVGPLRRLPMRLAAHYLRAWDTASASRVDHFVANSEHTRRRIARYYRRDADLVHPPVDVDRLRRHARPGTAGEFYLVAGQLTAYKRPDLAVRALSALGRAAVVIGDGEELGRLRRLAGPTVRFLGWQPDEVLHDHLARCRALVFAGEEDFGILPVECMAAGRPVIAYARGGACETVIDGETGVLFHDATDEGVAAAVQRFEAIESTLAAQRITAHAAAFDREHFKAGFRAVTSRVLEAAPATAASVAPLARRPAARPPVRA